MVQTSTSLNAARRTADLAALADGEVVDLLVVGLGVTGAGIALDAASRGLSVAALDAHDLAFGTSRWSSKLVHGGLRYLAKLDVGVAMESARERGVLMARTAPHLTRTLPMMLPLVSSVDRGTRRVYRAGLQAGDLLRRAAGTSAAILPRPRRVPAAVALAMAPTLSTDGLVGGYLHFDGQLEDDARLVIALARTAAGLGARIITYSRVLDLAGDAARVRDVRSGAEFTVRARAVVNATGVWAGSLVDGIRLRPSRGSHIVLRAATLGNLTAALIAPVAGQRGRFVFAIPEPDGLVYAGITDEPIDGPVPDVPEAPESDIAFLLSALSQILASPLRRDDVVGSFAGLRPLLETEDGGATADVSRKHTVLTSPDGVITIVGGKLTTYRQMAQDAVDAAIRQRGLTAGPCRTKQLPLVGAAPRDQLARLEAPARLIRRYGTEAPAVAGLGHIPQQRGAGAGIPDLTLGYAPLADPIAPGLAVTGAELVWGLWHEGALSVEDLIDRRCRIGLVPTDRRAALTMAEAVLAEHATGA
jgi:glycerol-3-phosphate dehydrogenase